ncbi:alpha/beta fold hydrolase [Streptomyces venezuelae]|uniref:alpha/beta fold hydrolase n=1 Tax=Streptomyces venezuelae TaxID=54571 RepID=UPI00343BB597
MSTAVAVHLVSHLPPDPSSFSQPLPRADRRARQALAHLCDTAFGPDRVQVGETRSALPELPAASCAGTPQRAADIGGGLSEESAGRTEQLAGEEQVHEPQLHDGGEAEACLDGGEADRGGWGTLPALLLDRCDIDAGGAVGYLRADGSALWSTCTELRDNALKVLALLKAAGVQQGEAVVVCSDDIQGFFLGLWGCFLGGFVPAPVAAPPRFEDGAPGADKVAAVAESFPGCVLLTTDRLARGARRYGADRQPAWRDVVSVDRAEGQEPAQPAGDLDSGDEALYLFTSGSTGAPKTVVLTHEQILTEAAGTARVFEAGPRDLLLAWMPPEHGASIAMMHVTALSAGMSQLLAMPHQILGDIARWPALMSAHRVTHSWAPQFAYGLLAEHLDGVDAKAADWDLSRIRVLLNGGEAVVSRTVRRFLKHLAPYGLPADSVRPAWGMAETSSGVCYGTFSLDSTRDEDRYVSVGTPIPGVRFRVTTPGGAVAAPGEQGALEIGGATVTTGYLDNPEANTEAFTDDGWFRTGDTAFIDDGQLTITGRTRDTIIINGANYFSHEIESVVEEIDHVESSYVAACAIRPEGSDTEQLAVFASVADGADQSAVLSEVSAAVLRTTGVRPDHVIPLRREDFPKTDLGKIQRKQLADDLRARLESRQPDSGGGENAGGTPDGPLPAWFHRLSWIPTPLPPSPGGRARQPVLLWVSSATGNNSQEYAFHVVREWVRACRDSGRRILRVVCQEGRDFAADGDDVALDPAAEEHLDRLAAHLMDAGLWPGNVLFLAQGPDGDEAARYESTRHSALGLAHCLRALDKAQALTPDQTVPAPETDPTVHLRIVSFSDHTPAADAGQDEEPGGDPAAAAVDPLLALATTAALELPFLHTSTLSLPADEPLAAAARHLMAELSSSSRETCVTYRNRTRHTARLLPHLPAADHRCGPGWQRNGRYILTGGFGALSTLLAEHLLTEWNADVVLVGRRPVPDDDTRDADDAHTAWERLTSHGPAFCYRQADVTDRGALAAVLDTARQRWQHEPTAVLHLAAQLSQSPVTDLTERTLDTVAAAKVRGAEHLADLLRGTSIPLVLFSSAAPLLGVRQLAAYAWANALLDHIALREAAAGHPVHSIAWGRWYEQGMSRGLALAESRPATSAGEPRPDRQSTDEQLRHSGLIPLSAEQGLRSLAVCMAHPAAHIIVGVHPAGDAMRHLQHAAPRPLSVLQAATSDRDLHGALSTLLNRVTVRDDRGTRVPCRAIFVNAPPTADQVVVERVASLVTAVLGQEVAADQDLYALGATSLQLSRLHVRIEKEFDQNISWWDMLSCRTARDLTALVEGSGAGDENTLTFDGVAYAYRTAAARQDGSSAAASPATVRVLLPGGFGMRSVPHFTHLLAADASVLVADLPGSGTADDIPEGQEDFAYLSACLDHLLEHTGHERIDLIGLSYGGSIALAYARDHPEKVARLVLLGTFPEGSSQRREELRRSLERLEDAGTGPEFIQNFTDLVMSRDSAAPIRNRTESRELFTKSLNAVGSRGTEQITASIRRVSDADDDRPAPDVPTLLFTGEHDILTPPDAIATGARAFPQGMSAAVRESDHAVFLQRPEETADLITRFLRDDLTDTPHYCTHLHHSRS